MYISYQDIQWDGEGVVGCEVCFLVEEESYLSWRFGGIGPEKDFWRRHSQDVSGSLVDLKGIRRNNLYYLKGSTVTENLVASEYLDVDSTWL